MRERVQIALLGAAFIWVVGTSAWTINEVGKNNRAILNLSMRTQEQEEARKVEIARAFDVLNRKIDRLLPATVGHEHSDVRRFMIAGHLARTVRPVVVFGDSITEGAILPNTICGHAVVNAGIGGAGVDELVNDAPSLLADKSAAALSGSQPISHGIGSSLRPIPYGLFKIPVAQCRLGILIDGDDDRLHVNSSPPVAPDAGLRPAP